MFWSLLRMAARNVLRNTRRSLLTASVILITTGAIVVGRGLLNGVNQAIIDSITLSLTGDVQLHKAGYLKAKEALPLALSFDWGDDLRADLVSDGAFEAAAGRITFAGLITDINQENTTPFLGRALDPDHEPIITPDSFSRVTVGEPISADFPEGIVIGEALAKGLGLKVGDEVTLLVTTQAGSLNGADVTIRGISSLQLPGLANKIVQIPLATGQRLLRMKGQATEVALKAKDSTMPAVEREEARLEARLAQSHPHLETNTWMDVSETYLDVFAMWDSVFGVFVAIFYIMMISGIINTMLMSVLERVTEIGMLMAIGVRRKRIVILFLMEALLLATLGSLAGMIVGGGLVAYFHEAGLYLPLAGNLPKIIHPDIQVIYMVWTALAAHVVAVGAAFMPVNRATRMTPVEALASS